MSSKPDRAKRKLRGGSIDMAWEEEVRTKLKTSGILNRLISFVNGEVSLEPAQVTACLGLLRKVLPDLSSSEVKNSTTISYVARVPNKAPNPIAWQEQQQDNLAKH